MKKLITPVMLAALVAHSPAGLAEDSALAKRIAALEEKMSVQGGGSNVMMQTQREKNDPISKGWLNREYVTSGNSKLSLALSGQINRAFLSADDGEHHRFLNVDSDASSTRFRMVGKAKLNDTFMVGSVWETAFQSNSTSAINQFSTSNSGSLSGRKFEFYLDHADAGRVWFGQGSTSADDTAELTLSGTYQVSYSYTADLAGGFLFRNTDISNLAFRDRVEQGTGATVQIGSAINNLDGGRDDRVRYDTPKWHGFQASASYMERGKWDASLTYSYSNDMLDVVAAMSYADPNSTTVSGTMVGSAAVLHKSSGLNASTSMGKRKHETANSNTEDPRNMYFQLGWRANLNRYGSTNFAIDYQQSKYMVSNSGKAKSVGGGVEQHLDALGADLYFGLRKFSYDDSIANYDDFNIAFMGARVKF